MPNYPRREGTKFHKYNSESNAYSDFTVQEFANSVTGGINTRLKKAQLHTRSSPAKILRNMDQSTEDLPWYERDVTDFDLSQNEEDLLDDVSEEKEKQDTQQGGTKKHAKRNKSEETGSVVYPFDVWFLLGDYIDPEDVACFASICQGCHVVTHTARFWQRLYKRSYYRSDIKTLPWDLHCSHMERKHGLRSRVIRSLFYVYPVFVERLRTQAPFQRDPDLLHGCTCALMWYHKEKTNWSFNFKFVKTTKKHCHLIGAGAVKSKYYRLSADDDIHINDEEGSYVLKVVCPDFVSIPSTMGLILTKAALSVGHGMRYHKLRLHFDQTFSVDDCRRTGSDVVLVIDPVLNLHILPWWHPRYAFQDKPTKETVDTWFS